MRAHVPKTAVLNERTRSAADLLEQRLVTSHLLRLLMPFNKIQYS